MSATLTNVTSLLNDLIETCKDGEDGFRAAAEGVGNADLQNMFKGLCAQRREFARDLQSLVRDLDEPPEKRGSVAGAIHRGWIRLRSAITSGDEAAILAECERGEESAVEQYQEALEHYELPIEVWDVIHLQFMGVQGSLRHLREVRGHFA
jgi:uncharacterized protein (TIGR02284 family)